VFNIVISVFPFVSVYTITLIRKSSYVKPKDALAQTFFRM
jgi:hypothetical protein